jgi:hypothetical protein
MLWNSAVCLPSSFSFVVPHDLSPQTTTPHIPCKIILTNGQVYCVLLNVLIKELNAAIALCAGEVAICCYV